MRLREPEAAPARDPLVRAAFATSALGVGRAGLACLTGVLTARWLGPVGRGEVAWIVTAASLLALVAAAGLTAATPAYRAVGHGAGRVEATDGGGLAGAMTALALRRAGFVVALGVPVLAVVFRPSAAAMVAVTGLAVLLTVTTAGLAVAGGRGRAGAAATANIAGAALLLVVVTIVGGRGRLTTGEVVVGWLGSAAVTVAGLAAVGGVGRPRAIPAALRTMARRANVTETLLFALWRVDALIVWFWSGAAALGRYAVAVSLAEAVMVVVHGVRLALLRSANDAAAVARVVRLVLVVVLPAAGAIGAAAPLLVPLLFGDAYRGAVPAVLVLLPGVVLFGLVFPMLDSLATRGRAGGLAPRVAVVLVIAATADSVLLGAAHAGIASAAAVSTLAYAAVFALVGRRAGLVPLMLRGGR